MSYLLAAILTLGLGWLLRFVFRAFIDEGFSRWWLLLVTPFSLVGALGASADSGYEFLETISNWLGGDSGGTR